MAKFFYSILLRGFVHQTARVFPANFNHFAASRAICGYCSSSNSTGSTVVG